jgi:penicillin amidase
LKGARLRALFFEYDITRLKIMRSTFALLIALFLGACATDQTREETGQPQPGPVQEQNNQVRLVRDNHGVPHIYSDSVFGLYYGYGYAVAQDRLFQMEMARRSTQGMVAGILGTEYVEFDRNARMIFSPASIHLQLDALEGTDKDIFDGFAAGFNAWLKRIEADPGNLMPKQFVEFGFEPVEWTAYDVAMIFVGTMANRFGDFNTELDNVQILQSLVAQHGEQAGADIFNLLNPRYTNNAPTTIPAGDWSKPVPDVLAGGPKSDGGNYRQAALNRTDAFTGPVISGFSNCFVLGRDKVDGASAILLNGPQFGWFTPSYVYSVGMHGAGIDVVGNTPFAYPMIMFGHNASITWGSTWGAGDIVDIFAERLNPEDATQYFYQDGYRNFEHRTELIEVRDGEAITLDVYRSVHGPVTLVDQDAGVAYARHRSWDGREIEQLLSWVHATWASDFETWKTQAEKSSINVNMYFADTIGNVGYFYGGHYPQRARGHDNRFPVTGDGSMDWQGRLPIKVANPHVLNPSSGFVANWNNKPAQGVMNSDQFWYSWSEADRVDYLNTELASRGQFTPDDAWRLITTSSFVELHAPYLLPLIDQAVTGHAASHAASHETGLGPANEILQTWDLQSRDLDRNGYYDGAATAIFRTFAGKLIEAVLADDLGDVFPPFAATGYPAPGAPTGAGTNIQTGMKAVIESLGGRGGYDLLNGRSANEVVNEALLDTLAALRDELGEDMAAWRLPVAERPYLTSNFLGIPQTFEHESMTQHIEQNRGTENNMVIMNEDRIIGYEVTPPGQNAFISPAGSKGNHFDDQFDLYSDFGRKRMWFYQADVEANKQSETVLSY